MLDNRLAIVTYTDLAYHFTFFQIQLCKETSLACSSDSFMLYAKIKS